MAFPSASTATATPSSSATIRTGLSPNNSLENNLPLNSDALSTNSASSRFPPTRPKPRVASNASGALARTAWSANSASPAPPPWSKPTPYWPSSASTTTSALPAPPPNPFATFAPCRAALILPAASVCATSASSPPTTPLPWARSPLRCRPCPARAATLAKPSNSLINSMAACASFAVINSSARCLCPSNATPNAARLPLPRRRTEQPRCAAPTTSAAALLSPPLLNRLGGDRVSLQLIRHFLVATTTEGGVLRVCYPTK